MLLRPANGVHVDPFGLEMRIPAPPDSRVLAWDNFDDVYLACRSDGRIQRSRRLSKAQILPSASWASRWLFSQSISYAERRRILLLPAIEWINARLQNEAYVPRALLEQIHEPWPVPRFPEPEVQT